MAKLVLLLCLVVMHCPLPAQESTQDNPPLIRSSSRLVLLDVVVTDKAGHPLSGLSKDDFTVLENGTPQKVASFEALSVEGSGTVYGSRTIILLDELNITFSDLSYARDRVMMFLDRNPSERQPTALMAIGPHGLTLVQDFTQDSGVLKDQLTHLAPYDANPKGGIDSDWARERAQSALRALMQIARAAVGSPQSLNVIWVTSGFSGVVQKQGATDPVESGLRSVANLLIHSRMRLYTIDPSGVIPFAKAASVAKVSRGNIRDGHESSAEQLLGSTHGAQTTANDMLARMTATMGGLSYSGRNDVDVALEQAVLDGSSAYVISYAPSDTRFEGGYRKIEVRTTIADASVRTRNGYYAVSDDAATDQAAREAVWDAALASPLIYTGLNVTCPVTYDAAANRLSGKITTASRHLATDIEEKEQVIRVASFSEDLKLLDRWSYRIDWKDPWTNQTVSATFDKVLSPKARTVRFLVSDPAAQRVGTCLYRLR